MPTPSRTSREAIVAAARDILETRGPQGLTMQSVAQSVGVKAPSLYKHVADREALVRLVADAAATELGAHLATRSADGSVNTDVTAATATATATAASDGTASALAHLAHGLRAWAVAHPEAYRLVFSGHGSPEVAAATSGPVLTIAQSLAGDEDSLAAARMITAWATGFISMELAGAFQLGGDVDEAFTYGIEGLSRALADR